MPTSEQCNFLFGSSSVPTQWRAAQITWMQCYQILYYFTKLLPQTNINPLHHCCNTFVKRNIPISSNCARAMEVDPVWIWSRKNTLFRQTGLNGQTCLDRARIAKCALNILRQCLQVTGIWSVRRTQTGPKNKILDTGCKNTFKGYLGSAFKTGWQAGTSRKSSERSLSTFTLT